MGFWFDAFDAPFAWNPADGRNSRMVKLGTNTNNSNGMAGLN